MNRNVLTVIKKEFARFFKDPRMVLTALILPGLMIYVVYSFLGVALKGMLTPSTEHLPVIKAINMPHSIKQLMLTNYELESLAASEIENIKPRITAKEVDLLLVFPEDFDERVDEFLANGKLLSSYPPNIEMYYNSTNPNSSDAYRTFSALLSGYKESLAPLFSVNSGVEGDLATQQDVMAFSIAGMLPFLLIIMMFSGCMSLAPESIAGEKERGTIATILVTPIKRSELAIGKILSLGALAFLCGLSSCLGVFLSLPKMMSMGADNALDMNIYAPLDYVLIALIVLSSVLLIVAAVSIISAFAKTVKEATSSVMPLMLIVMVVGLTSMFGKTTTDTVLYLVPLYNSVQAMGGVFKFEYSATAILITVVSNLIYACICGFALTRMFNSEKLIFSK